MSGGALDYAFCRLEDPIKEIEDRIKKNGKTVQQIWNEKTESEKEYSIECGHDWEIPWNEKNVPDSIRIVAEDEAWKKCSSVKHEQRDGYASQSLPTKKARIEWQKIYNETLKQMIESHNGAVERETYSSETIETLNKMLKTIKRAKIYLERIEWLFSGDDGEEDLIERTKEDLKNGDWTNESSTV